MSKIAAVAKAQPHRGQAEADRRVTQALKKEKVANEERVAKAADKAKKEAERQKLLDNNNLEELAETYRKEAEEARAALADRQRQDDVDKLLDNEEVGDAGVRSFFKTHKGELEDIAAGLATFNALVDKRTEALVNERLKTPSPPAGQTREQEGHGDPRAQIAAAQKKGDHMVAFRLQDAAAEEAHRRAQGHPAATV